MELPCRLLYLLGFRHNRIADRLKHLAGAVPQAGRVDQVVGTEFTNLPGRLGRPLVGRRISPATDLVPEGVGKPGVKDTVATPVGIINCLPRPSACCQFVAKTPILEGVFDSTP